MKISQFIAVNFWQQRIEGDALHDGIHFLSIKIYNKKEIININLFPIYRLQSYCVEMN